MFPEFQRVLSQNRVRNHKNRVIEFSIDKFGTNLDKIDLVFLTMSEPLATRRLVEFCKKFNFAINTSNDTWWPTVTIFKSKSPKTFQYFHNKVFSN